MQSEAAALDEGRVSQHRAAEPEKLPVASSNSGSYANCVSDVERHRTSPDIKAELIAACRTAGKGQKDVSTTTVSDCVSTVERSGASEDVIARQVAICHGGDVKPLYVPVPVQRTGSR